MATLEQKNNFIATFAPYAYVVADETGLPYDYILTQSALESGWNTSTLSKNYNNLFGMKAGKSWTGDTVVLETHEDDGTGRLKKTTAEFRVYESPLHSFRDWYDNLKRNPQWYGKVLEATNTAEAIGAIHESPYATDTKYGKKLIDVYNTVISLDEYAWVSSSYKAGNPDLLYRIKNMSNFWDYRESAKDSGYVGVKTQNMKDSGASWTSLLPMQVLDAVDGGSKLEDTSKWITIGLVLGLIALSVYMTNNLMKGDVIN